MVTASRRSIQHAPAVSQGHSWVEAYRALLSPDAVRNDPFSRVVGPMHGIFITGYRSSEFTANTSSPVSENQEVSRQFLKRADGAFQQGIKSILNECRKQHIELIYRHLASELPKKKGNASSEPQPLSEVIEDYLVEVLTESPLTLSKVLENYYALDARKLDELADVTQKFCELADKWKTDTYYVSSMSMIVNHPAYQEIIQMGESVVPLILRELANSPDWWFAALEAIVDSPPTLDALEGDLEESARVWVDWGITRGYISDNG